METTLHYLAFDEIGITVAVIAVAMAFIVLTWNAVKAIHDWRILAGKPSNDKMADHEARIKRLESCCDEVHGKLASDFKWQQSTDEMNTLLLRSIKHLIQHAVDGNDTQKLEQIEAEIDDYLLKHRK